MSDAKLKAKNAHNQELRYASRKSQTWPGYSASAPLGKAGYWFGSFESHKFLGKYPDREYLISLGFNLE